MSQLHHYPESSETIAALLLQKLGELLQLGEVQIRDGPPLHAGTRPTDQIVALANRRLPRCFCFIARRPNEHVDWMLSPLIDDRGDRAAFDVVESPACQNESLLSQVFHRRREIQLAIKPGL